MARGTRTSREVTGSAGLGALGAIAGGASRAADVTAGVDFGTALLVITPEPGTAALLGLGLAATALLRRRRR